MLFESAINMETSSFFRNFGTINLYAILGTFLACFITGVVIFIPGWIGISTVFIIPLFIYIVSPVINMFCIWCPYFSDGHSGSAKFIQVNEYELVTL
jgi:hypothetical protein